MACFIDERDGGAIREFNPEQVCRLPFRLFGSGYNQYTPG